ncbi:MAG: hypothetical protein AVDCRST_MAG37-1044 [uncultured Rubrobacteraceae bacterium]|uniref:DUF4126 domain-containing protein n=1 Tax=uncultured Rubrobacteraceae bacterium TaxID=349277 RepID=A0A6J4QBC1_9ACTN|nr:MAG: hypothetical protein AVDCRST_MAG37-1044 [uncultured Rubrobacteraceae bacterium]
MPRRGLFGRRRTRVEFEVTPATFRTLGLAGISGLRSMSGPALLARAVRRGDARASNLPALSSARVSNLLSLLAVGEMIADKTPFVPARTSAPALLGRALSGALVGAELFSFEGRSRNSGAILGVLSALAAAYAGEKVRSAGTRKGIPDPLLATLEDRLVLSLGKRLLRQRS